MKAFIIACLTVLCIIIGVCLSVYVWYQLWDAKEWLNPEYSPPTAAEMHRLDNDLIMYCPSDAIRIIQRGLVGEGDIIQVDGVMGQ